MNAARPVLYVLLGTVAGAAAVLSFDALRSLALMCGFSPLLAWLLPVVVDAGAAAESLAWLGRACGSAALSFGRALALVLLTSSVCGNAVVHALIAYGQRPHWLLVVAVLSAVAPAVLGAVVHLSVLVSRATAVAATAGPAVVPHLPLLVTLANLSAAAQRASEHRPGSVTPPGPTRDGPPTPAPARPTARQRRAAADRATRSRRHRAGDHTTCLPATCPDAPRVRAV